MLTKLYTILAFTTLGILLASSVFAPVSSPTGVKASVSWTSETGIGTSVPACSSATPNLSCVAEAPSVNLTGNYDGGHGTCDYANISITGGPSWTSQPCSNWLVNWNGAVSNATYSYDVKYWYDAPEYCSEPTEFGCSGWTNPPPAIIDQYFGSFTTPNCTPLIATCSVSPITANTGENVTWTALALGGAPTVKQGQDITPNTNAGWASIYDSTMFARRFQANGSYQLQRVAFYLARQAGTTGTLWVTLESDGGANPSRTVLATSIIRDASALCEWGAACGNWIAFSFDNYRLTSGTNYWLVVRGATGGYILPWANTGGDPAWDSRIRYDWTVGYDVTTWSTPGQSIAFLTYGPSYTYIWSGDEGLSGTTREVVKSYLTASPPPKSGAVTVNDGTRDAGPFACSNTVDISGGGLPDLVANAISRSGTLAEGNILTFTNTVTNSGDSTAGASTGRYCLDVSEASCLSSATGQLSTTAISSLTSSQISSPITQTWTAIAGSHTVVFCADIENVVSESSESTGSNCASNAFSVGAATVTASLSAVPSSGPPPLPSVLTATRTGGSAVGTKNYSFWWDCPDTTASASVAAASASCGSLPAPSAGSCLGNTNGYKCDGITLDTQDTTASGHTYSTSGTAKVIIEQGGASDQEQKPVTITGGPLSAACDVSPKSVGIGQLVSWYSNPSGGTSPYTFSWTGSEGLSSALQNPTKTYSTIGQKTASVTVTDSASANFTSNCTVASGNFVTVYTPILVITPSSATLPIGGTEQFTATYDADGAGPGDTTNVTNSATWSSSDGAVAIDYGGTKGLARGNSVGSANIGAMYSSTDAIPVPVTVASALFCSASPNPVSINAPVTFTASGGASSGDYNWSGGGTPASQSSPSPSFTTRYSVTGNKTVSLTRGSDTANCSVNVSGSGGNGFIEIPPD